MSGLKFWPCLEKHFE